MARSLRKYRLGYTQAEYQKKIESGEWQLHNFPKGFLITEIRNYAEERVLIVHLLGGEDFRQWMWRANLRISEFAKENGCAAIEAVCRVGLEKQLTELGYGRHRVVMRKDL